MATDARRSSVEFGALELAEPVDRPPQLFDRMRVPCACGGTLVGEEYAFFPSTLFIRGTCIKCGQPGSAMFTPPVVESRQERTARIAAEVTGFAHDLATTYKQDSEAVIVDFLDYLASRNA